MASKRTRDRRAEAGLCSECGQARARSGWRTCVGCRSNLDAVKIRAKQNGWRDRRLPAHERRKLTLAERREWMLWKTNQPKRGASIDEESRQTAESPAVPVSPVERSAEHLEPSVSTAAVAAPAMHNTESPPPLHSGGTCSAGSGTLERYNSSSLNNVYVNEFPHTFAARSATISI